MPPPEPKPATPAPWKAAVFLPAAAYSATPWASAPIALALGCVLALAGVAAFRAESRAVSKQLIQWSVATLGLLVPLPRLVGIAREGLLFAAATIIGTFVLAILAGRLLKAGREQTTLIASGTAICGGSAIAAVGSSIAASSAGMAIATAAVFLLNAAALYLFPAIGHALHLTDTQFGTWAGVAIHDVSSVTGAAASYEPKGGPSTALDVATVVKLSRVLWIVPIALVAGWHAHRSGATDRKRLPIPWLIILFVLASLAATFVGPIARYAREIRFVATLGFQLALFLIGSGLSVAAIREVGWRTLLLAVILWIAIAGGSLVVVMKTVV